MSEQGEHWRKKHLTWVLQIILWRAHSEWQGILWGGLRWKWHELVCILKGYSGFSSKEFTCQCTRLKRLRFALWVGKIPWSRKWQPTPVFLPGESHGQRSLVGCSPWDRKESDMTEWAQQSALHWLCWEQIGWVKGRARKPRQGTMATIQRGRHLAETGWSWCRGWELFGFSGLFFGCFFGFIYFLRGKAHGICWWIGCGLWENVRNQRLC